MVELKRRSEMKFKFLSVAVMVLTAVAAGAQTGELNSHDVEGPNVMWQTFEMAIDGPDGVPFEMAQNQTPPMTAAKRVMRTGPPDVIAFSAVGGPMMGPWWKNSEIANELHLTDQQKKEIEQGFYQYRLQMIDATAGVQKLDMQLDSLMNADALEESQINQVLDQLVQARGQLSKMYAGMLISIRKVLLPEQWKKLQALQAEKGVMPMMFGAGPVMMEGPGGPMPFTRRLPPPPGQPGNSPQQ
jgi:Spy/CpxP family protein refolding chaperone